MNDMKKWVLLAALILAALGMLAGCAGVEEPAPIQQATQPPVAAATDAPAVQPTEEAVPAAAESSDDVLLRVNGREITRAQTDAIAGELLSVYAAYGMDVTGDETVALLRSLALETAVQLTLVEQKGEEWGIAALTEEEKRQVEADTDAEWEELVSFYMRAAGADAAASDEARAAARETAIATLADMGCTRQNRLDRAVSQLRTEKVQAEMVKDVTVSEAEIQAAYEAQVAQDEAAYKNDVYAYELDTHYYEKQSCYVPAGYRGVVGILLEADAGLMAEYHGLSAMLEEQVERTSEGGDAADAADASAPVTQADLDEVRTRILDNVSPVTEDIRQRAASGELFSALVDEYNTAPMLASDEAKTLGVPVHMDSVVYDPALVQAAFSVDHVGEVSAPVVGSQGVYIVRYVRDVAAGPVPLDESLRGELTERLLAALEAQVISDTLNAWMAEAEIVYTEAGEAYLASGK